MRLTGMILAALAGQPTAQTPQVPMQPSGPWSLEYAKDACVLSRTYGPKDQPIILAIMRRPLSPESSIAVVGASMKAGGSLANKATVTIGQEPPINDVQYQNFRPAIGMPIVTRMDILDTLLAGFKSSSSIYLKLIDSPAMVFALSGQKNALVALEKCMDQLQQSWGIDPKVVAKIAVLPVRKEGRYSWTSAMTYPEEARRRGEQGESVVLWKIDPTGKPADCRVLTSSGFPRLDRAACIAIISNDRFIPAKDDKGVAVISYQTRTVRWVIPAQ